MCKGRVREEGKCERGVCLRVALELKSCERRDSVREGVRGERKDVGDW